MADFDRNKSRGSVGLQQRDKNRPRAVAPEETHGHDISITGIRRYCTNSPEKKAEYKALLEATMNDPEQVEAIMKSHENTSLPKSNFNSKSEVSFQPKKKSSRQMKIEEDRNNTQRRRDLGFDI